MMIPTGNPAITAALVLLSFLFGPPQQKVKNPTPAKTALRYTLSNANIIFSINTNGLLQQTNAGIQSLSKDPLFQHPILQGQLEKAKTDLQNKLKVLAKQAGFDPFSSIRQITISAKLDTKKPNSLNVLLAMSGDLNREKLLKLAKRAPNISKPEELNGWVLIINKAMLKKKQALNATALTPDGQILFGNIKFLRHLIKNPITRAACPSPTAYCRMLSQYNPSHLLASAVQIPKNLPIPRRIPAFLRSFYTDVTGAHAAMQVGGSQLTLWGKNPHSVRRYHTILQGVAHLTKASDQGARGMILFMKGLLDFNPKKLPPQFQMFLPMKDAAVDFLSRQFLKRAFKAKASIHKDKWTRLELEGPSTPLIPIAIVGGSAGAAYFWFKKGTMRMQSPPSQKAKMLKQPTSFPKKIK